MGSTINPFGKEIIKVETEFCGQTLSLEVNRVGFRATGAVIARYGETVVLASAVVGQNPVSMDYFPLSVEYEEKMYAAGKISGSRFIKREGRPSDDAILIGRLIDRPIRPLWPKGYRHEVQVVATVLSMDPTFRPDAIAMIATSAALMLTGAPFDGPVAGVRVGMVGDDYKAFATAEELKEGALDLVVAGTEKAIMMVEAGAREVTEEQVVGALDYAFAAIQPAVALQRELVKQVGVTPQAFELNLPNEDIQKEVDAWLKGKMGAKIRVPYAQRHEMMHELREDMLAHFEEKLGEALFPDFKAQYAEAFAAAANNDVRAGIIKDNLRPDGRQTTEIRQLSSEVGFLPRTHGSSLFTRGMTQGMNIVTLAPLSYAQVVDTMEKEGERRYMHHYNAPGYTVGEARRMGSPGRREIGHGYLAERALDAVLPSEEDFPYAIRSVTEIMSQHGSTSMAATCSSCLALMDAGVPITAPVSGIAMGLILDGDRPIVLSDIADAEDFAGDMDFKVAGTAKGITAVQMDMKVHGLGTEILAQALAQGKEGRAHILKSMLETLAAPREQMSPFAPRIEKVQINPEKIRDVIGKGGEMINKIIAETGAEIDIRDSGLVMVAAPDKKAIDAAIKWIKDLTSEPEVGTVYENARVVKLMDFGIFVEVMPGHEGLVHVSEMADKRVEHPGDMVKEGDRVTVKLVAVDDRGRLVLSMKQAK